MDAEELYQKIASYCAYQERSLKEVTQKLVSWEVPDSLHQKYIDLLISEKYLEQERFANTFARSKIHLKKWGKTKVKIHLRQKGVDESTINDSLSQISPEEYRENAKKLVLIKRRNLKQSNNKVLDAQKIVRYLLSKGFEMDVIKKALDEPLDF